MIPHVPEQKPGRKQPRFLWRGLLIVLPAFAMASFGFLSLRQDRLLARHQATEEAQKFASELAEVILPNALQLDLGMPSGADPPGIEQARDDPVLIASRRGIIAYLTDNTGATDYPAPVAWPVPEPLDLGLLDPDQLKSWTSARRELFQGKDPATAMAKFQAMATHGLPSRFEALVRFHLLDLSLRAGQIGSAVDQLDQIRQHFAKVKTEAGLPLRLLAEWRWFHSANQTPGGTPATGAEAGWNWLCAQAVFDPGPLTPEILDDVRQSKLNGRRQDNGGVWDATWKAHEQARALARLRKEAGLAAAEASGQTNSGWFEVDQREYYITSQDAVKGGWWVAWPEQVLFDTLQQALKKVSLPAYLGCAVEVGGRAVPGTVKAEPVLAIIAGSSEDSADRGLSVAIGLADPNLLYARQQMRTWWFGSLIAISAGSVLCGVLAAWRGFRDQQRLAEMQGNFVSSVSHEMRAPIASVRLMAEELVDRGPSAPEKSGEYHGYILQECRRLSGLIENVLDFSRHEQGRKQYHFERTDLRPVVDETIHVMRSYASEQKVTIRQQIEGTPFDLDLDAAAIQQVVVNLLDNAIKHSPAGAAVEVGLAYPSPGLHPATHTHQLNNGATPFRLSVRDQGPGIPDDEQRRIFQRFYRRGTELRRETQGIGLGLAIVQYIAEAHGGTARVESCCGQGSRFIVELPVPHAKPS